MNGQKLLNNTLRVNAFFSLLSGLDFILFDRELMGILSKKDLGSLASLGAMLIVFAIFVFAISMLKEVNKYLVGAIILMDVMWVLGSGIIIVTSASFLTMFGIMLISIIALIIAVFASLQILGMTKHLKDQTA